MKSADIVSMTPFLKKKANDEALVSFILLVLKEWNVSSKFL